MNKEQIAEKKRITKEVRNRIASGEPKQSILEALSQLHKDKITIVKQLEATPSKSMKRKYLILNYALSVLLLAALVLDAIMLIWNIWGNPLLDFTTCLNVALDALLLVGVLRYRIESYSWIAARGIVSLLEIMVTHVYYHLPIDPLTYTVLALIFISFLAGLFLSVRLCPARVPKIIEVDIDGVEKIKKTVYVFPD